MKTRNWLVYGSSLLAALAAPAVHALEWERAQQLGGSTGGLLTQTIAVDAAGNSHLAGYFSGTVQLGSHTLTSQGGLDIFLARQNAAGDFLWATSAGGYDHERAGAIALDNSGNIYVAGSFEYRTTFGSATLVSNGGEDVFLAKYSSSGDLLWVRSGGGRGVDTAEAIAVDAAGNAYLTGSFAYVATFGNIQLKSAGGADIFVLAFSPSGDELWGLRAGSSSLGFQSEAGKAIAVDGAGDIYLAGHFNGTALFGSTWLWARGNQDMFVAKIDGATHHWTWVSQAGGARKTRATQLDLDPAGDVVIAGTFEGSATFGSTTLSSGSYWVPDYFIAKYTPAGQLQWVQQAGGSSYFEGHGLGTDDEGNIYLGATFEGTVTIGDSEITSAGWDNFHVTRLDPQGSHEWTVHVPGSFYCVLTDVAVHPRGDVYVGGWFQGTAEFDGTLLERNGPSDSFVAKLVLERAVASDLTVKLDILPGSCPNPFNRKSKGVLPVVLAGSVEVDVSQIDLSTLSIWRADGIGEIVAPSRKPAPAFEDVVAASGEADCGESDADGLEDVVLKFSSAELVEALELANEAAGSSLELVVSGALLDGTPFSGSDSILIRR